MSVNKYMKYGYMHVVNTTMSCYIFSYWNDKQSPCINFFSLTTYNHAQWQTLNVFHSHCTFSLKKVGVFLRIYTHILTKCRTISCFVLFLDLIPSEVLHICQIYVDRTCFPWLSNIIKRECTNADKYIKNIFAFLRLCFIYFCWELVKSRHLDHQNSLFKKRISDVNLVSIELIIFSCKQMAELML